jgi:hypothetical protein
VACNRATADYVISSPLLDDIGMHQTPIPVTTAPEVRRTADLVARKRCRKVHLNGAFRLSETC